METFGTILALLMIFSAAAASGLWSDTLNYLVKHTQKKGFFKGSTQMDERRTYIF